MALKTFNVNHDIYKKFSDHCKKEGISMSKKVEKFLKNEIDKIDMMDDKSGSLFGHHTLQVHKTHHNAGGKSAVKNKNKSFGNGIIAIVGSHVDSVTALSNYLEAKGYKTCWAYLGTEAIPLCTREHPSLLIIDSTLAGMGAFEIARLMPNQKILVMTALDDLGPLASQFRNIIGIVKKPLDVEEVENIIRKKVKN